MAARAHTRRVADDLSASREFGPKLPIVNPPRWELGHVGWFQEFWCLRRAGRESILPNADALYNSATVAHDERWILSLPSFSSTLEYRDEVLRRVVEQLHAGAEADGAYFVQLAARHEEMHAEAFHYTRQTLGYPAPQLPAPGGFPGNRVSGDAELPGGRFEFGARPGAGFAFDNEKWSHRVVLAPFRISRAAVTNAQYREFVEADGYRKREYWSDAAWACKDRDQPLYWSGDRMRRFDRWMPIAPEEPVVHVSWYEAEAYCRFAGRRLPTEAEWEYAATLDPVSRTKRRYPWGDDAWTSALANLEGGALAGVHDYPRGDSAFGLRQMIGNAWEWTASTFLPYPGFLRDPYQEYSEPWFGTHKVLRGGSFATPARVVHGGFRNFYTPDRADIFAGFRTCAL
jgi:iron(II)-dependent oxidoreductase